MNDDTKQFKKITFFQLLERCSIEIPIIQRDYAQGRGNKQKIRDKFLTVLFEALTADKNVELDFIYGSEENKILQPLDGQQRLTTLFLLHWYIANKENKIEEAKEILSKFTYETRATSRDFCIKLVKESVTIESNKDISESIKEDTVWFISSWKDDSTVAAMLTMLDAIHSKFKNTSGIWDKLIDKDNSPITFLYVKLENFGLSDDLYIKMNARGKQLTDFENFKSQFEKHIEKNEFEKDIEDPVKKFAHKIDTTWTDLFWKYRDKDGLIDSKLTNFIASIAINCYAAMETNSNKVEVEQRIKMLSDNPNEISIENFSTVRSFNYLVACFIK